MKIKVGNVQGVIVIDSQRFHDVRGQLLKTYSKNFTDALPSQFLTQELFFTFSKMNVFRGMHFQESPHSLAKVVSIIQGNAIDYLLDIRRSSPTFGSLQIVELKENLPVSIYIPDGIAHGYLSISNDTIISYMFDGVFCENCDTGISGLDIEEFLPIGFGETLRSVRDQELPDFKSFSHKSKCKS